MCAGYTLQGSRCRRMLQLQVLCGWDSCLKRDDWVEKEECGGVLE